MLRRTETVGPSARLGQDKAQGCRQAIAVWPGGLCYRPSLSGITNTNSIFSATARFLEFGRHLGA